MKIILIGNKAQHGKDTFANMLQKELEVRGNSCSIIHFADCLKFVCKEFFDWDGEKNAYGRSLLQAVGNEMREVDEHFWTDFVARYIKFDQTDYILIPDWRHQEEYERLLEYFDYDDIITVNIMRFVDENTPYVNEAMTEEQRIENIISNLGDTVTGQTDFFGKNKPSQKEILSVGVAFLGMLALFLIPV